MTDLFASRIRVTLVRDRICRDAAPSDLQFLTDENIAEIGAQWPITNQVSAAPTGLPVSWRVQGV